MRKLFLFLSFLLMTSNIARAQDAESTLITNAKIVDGTGNKAYSGSILIQNGIIQKIGNPDEIKTDNAIVINAGGRVVSPGFIDMHSHGNPLRTPEFKNFLAMGITTISLGQDGGSVSTTDVSGWMDKVDSAQTGPNVVHLQGHGTLRNLADAPMESGLDESYITKMQQLMENAMKAGSFGMTTGLEYEPGKFADMNELALVAKPVAEYGGIIKSHMRNEDADKVKDSIKELIEQGKKSGAPVHISHIKIVYGNDPEQADEILALLETERENGTQITADIYPYEASYTGIGIVFPAWAKAPNNFDEVVENRREELEEFLRDKIMQRNGPQATLFGTAPWTGMTLAEVADSLGKPFEDVLIDDIGPRGAGAAYFVMNLDVMRRLIQDEHVMISTDGSPTMQHPRSYGSFAKVIRQFVMDEKLLTLEEAIRKMSGLSAETLRLSDPEQVEVPRGFIKEGFAADLLIFDPENIQDKATYDNPHQLAEGFDWVLVNGIPVIKEGEFTEKRPGKVIRKKVNL